MLNNPSYPTFSRDSEYCQSVEKVSIVLTSALKGIGFTILGGWWFSRRLTAANPAIGKEIPRFGQSDVLPADVG